MTLGKKLRGQANIFQPHATRNILTGPNCSLIFVVGSIITKVNNVSSRYFLWRPSLSLTQTLYRSTVRKTSRAQTTHPGEIFRFVVAEFSVIILRAWGSPKEGGGFRFRWRKKFSTTGGWHSIKGARSGKQASLHDDGTSETTFSFGRVFFFLFSFLLSILSPMSRLFQKSFHSFTRGLLKWPIRGREKEARYLVKRKRKGIRTIPVCIRGLYR